MARFLVRHGRLKLDKKLYDIGAVVEVPESMASCPALERLPDEESAPAPVLEAPHNGDETLAELPKRKRKKARNE